MIFLYSHRELFKNSSNQLNNLANPDVFPKDYACIKENTNLEILDSITVKHSADIEVDNLIDNGGSNAYAYLLKVSK